LLAASIEKRAAEDLDQKFFDHLEVFKNKTMSALFDSFMPTGFLSSFAGIVT
jgi:hypothetical protein